MEVLSHKGAGEFCTLASRWCEENVKTHSAKSLFLPAGQTPVPLYQFWENAHPKYLRKLKLLQIDECMEVPEAATFRHFFERALPSYADRFAFLSSKKNGDSGFVDSADLAILGLGMNGHVAFHEPGLPANFTVGCVKLSPTTCLNLKLSDNSWGLSYGVGTLLKSKAILLMVRGASKRDVVRRLLSQDPELPASFLCSHPNLTLLADMDALV